MKIKTYHLFYLIPVVVSAYLFWQNTKPVLEVRCDFKKKTALCGELVPTARVAAAKNGIVIKEEPVYFDVRLPRKYDKVEAEVEYSGLAADILEFGVSRDTARRAFDFAPLENRVLDNLAWQKIEGGGVVLYQRKLVFKNIAEFEKKMPAFGETVVFRADAAPPPGALKGKGEAVIDFPVREGLKMLIYKIGGAPTVRADATGDFSANVFDMGGNLYKVEILAAKDIVFNKIFINSPYVAILDKIKFGRVSAPQGVYLAGSRLLAITEEADGVGEITAGGEKINIAETFHQYSAIYKNRALKKISIPRGNLEIGGTMFFLNQKNIFYPRYETFYSGINLDKINFIIASYKAPEGTAVKKAKASFNIKDAPAPGGKLRFIFSLPNAKDGELVKIKSVKLRFYGEEFTLGDILKKLKKTLKL